MRRFRQAALVVLVFAFDGVIVTTAGQSPFRVSDQQLEQLTVRLEAHTNSFHLSVNTAISQSFLKDAQVGDYMKRYVQEFDELTDRLRARSRGRKPVSSDVQEILNRAEYIDSFMNSYEFDSQAEGDWELLRTDLDQLASYYKIATHWSTPVYHGIPQAANIETLESRLIGTYQVDKLRSNDLNKIVRRAVIDLPQKSRVRLQLTLMRNLRTPKLIAIDRDGAKITFGSSLYPARIYEVVERAQTGNSERVATLLYGGQFRINTGSDADGLYSVTFWSTNLGSRLQVIRTALLNHLKRPIVSTSYYTKISDSAVFDLSEEEEIPSSPLGRTGLQKKN